jgi:hypothetical protein
VGSITRNLLRGLINDKAKAHDGEYAPEHVSRSTHQDSKMTLVIALDDRDDDTTTMLHMKPISSSIPLSQDHYTSHFDSACSYSDTSRMKAACPPTNRNFDHVSASLPRVDITTLLDENVHLKEMLVAQLDLIKQQAAMDKKQFLEEIFILKSRIKSL